jgi:CheY-like chemotaxis protein
MIELTTEPAPNHHVQPSQSKLTEPAPMLAPLSILLVDDNADTLTVMARLLGYRGHRVTTARTLLAAQTAARSQCFDLLISDISLPDGSGLELMREIRERSAMPGIALSGFGMDEDLRRSHEAGFAIHLVKPVALATLEAAMQQVTLASWQASPVG